MMMEGTLIWILVTAAAIAGGFALRAGRQHHRPPAATLTLAAITLVTSALGELFPAFLDALDRDRSSLLDGQVWRIVTPLFVQDGGWPGTIFNVVALVVMGTFVESLYGARTLLATYVVAGLVSEIAAYTVLQHQGFAGNSVADIGLAGLLAVTLIVAGPTTARVFGAIGIAAGIVLLAIANLHGVGFLVGALAGVVEARHLLRMTTPHRETSP